MPLLALAEALRSRRSLRLLPVLTLLVAALLAVQVPEGLAQATGPTTEFEDNGGSDWTSFEGEQAFLAEVDAASDRMAVTEIGRTLEDRPIQLVTLGHPTPPTVEEALARPTLYLTCSVHGNEPAGREACLIQLRDLALSEDPAVAALLSEVAILVTPSANPDGRAANARGNSTGADINRDHLNLRQLESQAIAGVIAEWEPEVVLDMHEYGPSVPVLYDDDVLVLWPRNVNVDDDLYDLSVELSQDWLIDGVEAQGYSADEYGVFSVGDVVDVTQTAGGPDEGILRNVGGLRHSIGILVESAVTPRLTDPTEIPVDGMPRRVASQVATIDQALAFMVQRGEEAMATTAASREAKAAEGADRSAPVYFDGQRQDSTIDSSGPPPSEEGTVDPPPCGYLLTAAQHEHVAATLDLLEIEVVAVDDGVEVPMGQAAEPLIPLLLDERGTRNQFTGTDATWDGEGVPTALDEGCAGTPEGPLVRRVAGQDLAETAAAASRLGAPTATTLVVATTADYADALAGAVLARQADAALLLSDPDELSDAVADEVTRRGADTAFLLGGTAALSAEVEEALAGMDVAVTRLAGPNRFATAAAVHDHLVAQGADPDRVTVVEGEHADPARGWPDAISGTLLGDPVLLVNAARLPEETAERIAGADVTIVGGTAAVGEAVAEEIAATAETVERIFGQTRYGTSLAVHTSRGVGDSGPAELWLASGRGWQEGLVAAANGLRSLLIDGQDPDGSPETTGWLADNHDGFDLFTVVGDEQAVTPAVLDALRELVGAVEEGAAGEPAGTGEG